MKQITSSATSSVTPQNVTQAAQITALVANDAAQNTNISALQASQAAQDILIANNTAAIAAAGTTTGASYTDRSGTITLGGTAQQLMAVNANRTGWRIKNNSPDKSMFWNSTGIAAGPATAGSVEILPGDTYQAVIGSATKNAISLYCATTGQLFSAAEWSNTVDVQPTDRSGVITAGGVSQILMAANANRKYWELENLSNGLLYFNDTGGAAGADIAGSYSLQPRATYKSPASAASQSQISIFGATTNAKFSALEK